jgi:hypothetical protein
VRGASLALVLLSTLQIRQWYRAHGEFAENLASNFSELASVIVKIRMYTLADE